MRLTGPREPAYDEILSAEAIEFVATLVRRFQPSLQQLLSKRLKIQAAFDSGEQKLDFNAHTKDIREKEWKVCLEIHLDSCKQCVHYNVYLMIGS